MDGIATVTGVASAERRPTAEVVPIGKRNADRSWARRATPPIEPGARPTGPLGAGAPAGPPRPARSGAATAALEAAPFLRSRCGRARDPLAPPPDTVVVASPGHAFALVEQARAREAALRAEHAAEVARLADALRDQKKAHAAEVERLRAGHAAALRRLVEAHWRVRDAARTGTERRCGPDETAAPGHEARSRVHLPGARGWLARITWRG